MQSKRNALTTLIKLAACVTLMAAAAAQAADEKKADPTGTWTWTTPARGGGADRTNSVTLKLDGEKLTGKMTAPGRGGGPNVEIEITNGKVSGDEVSFTVTREFNGNKLISKYTGKISGDTVKGKVQTDRNGEPQERDWEAKRQAEKK